MILNHKRVRQILHGITIIAFTVSVLFQLKNLYVYGGKPPKQIDGDDEDTEDETSDSEPAKEEVGYNLDESEAERKERINGRKNHE